MNRDDDKMNQPIDSLIDEMIATFRSSGYTQRSVQAKMCTLHTIAQVHRRKGFNEFSNEALSAFLDDAQARYQSGLIGRGRYMDLVKTADYLTQYHAKKEIDTISRNIPNGLTQYWENILQAVKDYPDWNEKSKASIRKFALPYIKWLQSNGHDTLESVDASVIRAYLIDCGERLSPNSIDTVKRCIKKFHKYLCAIGKTYEDFQTVFSFTVPTEHKVKKPADLDEVAQVLSSINRGTAIGKRDYAVILLATVTGLRSVDIIELTFDEIDWINGEIIISQSKTNQSVALPLTADIGQALQDYILNSRPQSALPNVFLRVRTPFLQMGRSMPYQIYNGYRQKLGLPKSPFHGLRRAVGSNMVISGVPVTMVAQVLGHSSIEPTKQYISLDSVHLKECALDLTAIPMKPGGAR